MTFFRLKQPNTELEAMLCQKADELVNDKSDELTSALDLFVALSIYKLHLRHSPLTGISMAKKSDDRVQVNLFKDGKQTGVRIFHIGEHGDTAMILE